MSLPIPNDPKPATEATPVVPAAAAQKLTRDPGPPLPSRFAPYGGGKPMPPSRLYPGRSVRPNIAPAAMRQQRHGRHDG